MTYKCLTVWQPYASLLALGVKRYETREWEPGRNQLRPGDVLLIHAAKRKLGTFEKRLLCPGGLVQKCIEQAGYNFDAFVENMPFGAFVATTQFVAAHPTDLIKDEITGVERMFGDYGAGRYAWELDVISRPPHPIEATGRQTIWHWKPVSITVTTDRQTFEVSIERGRIVSAAPAASVTPGQPITALLRRWPDASYQYMEAENVTS